MTTAVRPFRAAGLTDVGAQRVVNEDRFFADAGRGIFIVIDGVGGQAAGGRAADTALAIMCTQLASRSGSAADRVREAIAAANNLPNANYIYTGQRLIIPAAPRPVQTYVVRQGDTLFSIAQRYGTTVQVIQTANNLPNPNAIYAGQTLQIP